MNQPGLAQLQLWCSAFGRDYTDRNAGIRPERVASWRRILDGIAPTRVLEVGCNVGLNLSYLRLLGLTQLTGIEPQAYAVEQGRARDPSLELLQGTAFELPFESDRFDLAFTSGVLIHISPTALPSALAEIYRVSRRWIVAIEYDDPSERELPYRGEQGALWKRDHGARWQQQYPDLRCIRRLALGPADGYDDCTAHVFEKGG